MAHIPHNPATLLPPHSSHNNHIPSLKMKSPVFSKPFLSYHKHHRAGGPSLRSILVLTFITLYGLQSFLKHFSTYNPSVSQRFSPSSSASSSSSSSRTSFGEPFPTTHSTTHQSRRSRRQQQHTYSPQEQQQQQQRRQQYQTWYNDNDYQYQYEQPGNEPEEQTEFEKMFYNGPSYYDNDHKHSDYDSTSYTTPHPDQDQGYDTFGAFDAYSTNNDVLLPGADCAGYYCADTQTCVDKPLSCPCPHVLDTKCLRADWFVCYRGPHTC